MAVTTPVPPLTAREEQCLRLVAQGYSSDEIARELGLSPFTVDKYVEAAMRKLDSRGRGRRVAARDFVREHPPAPDQIAYEPLGVEPDPPIAVEAAPANGEGAPGKAIGQPAVKAGSRTFLRHLPIRRKDERFVGLTTMEILIWVPVLALLISALLGIVLTNLETTKRLREEGVIGPLNPPRHGRT